MKTLKVCLLAVFSAGAVGTAQAQLAKTEHGVPDAPTRLMSASTNSTGSIIKKNLRWRSKIPLNKTYEQLNPEQLAELRGMYESLADGDEPPFPAKGLGNVFREIKQGQDVLQARGELKLNVTVGPDGVATDVEDFGTVGGVNAHEMTTYVAAILMKAPYKPAMCQGKPCTMQFPFKLKLD